MLTKDAIHAFLKENGISPRSTVLVHTSMRSLGGVEGGCDGLIDGFTSYLTEGLFIVPTHTWRDVGGKNPTFDVRSSEPCIGALPTVAAFRKDGVRSLHPTHSVAAFGKRAAEFVAGEERATSPCPRDGVWARLYDEGATILLIGVGLERNTYIHAVDEMIGPLPERLTEPMPLTVVDGEGRRHELMIRKHNKGGSDNFGTFRVPLERCRALRYGRLGEATVAIFDTVRGTEVIKHLWSVAEYDLTLDPREIPESYYASLL